MHWNQYLACFFAGMFLANAVPHFTNGISGDSFPTPFAKPPGKGLSSPVVNVIWALANVVAGYFLVRGGHLMSGDGAAVAVFFAGVVVISILCSVNFTTKHPR